MNMLLPFALSPQSIKTDRPLIVDSFAGGGGASTGIEMALGRSPDLAINHNPAALALHAANHPETVHVSENIYKVDPVDYVRGRHVGLAWFSPDCKHFSKAKGGKPVEKSIRDLAWVVVRWAKQVRPDVIILENVEEFRTWGPLINKDGRFFPDPERKGETFSQWCAALKAEGYKLSFQDLRACDYGAPTIRKRFFMVARRDGLPIVWPAPTHGSVNDPDVISGKKKPYRTAAEIIDWSMACPSIFDSKETIRLKHGIQSVRPLAEKTLSRIARGVRRYVINAPKPFLVSIAHGDSGSRREYSLDDPYGVVTASGCGRALITPVITAGQQGGFSRPIDAPHHTVTASNKDCNCVLAPHLMVMRNSEKPFSGCDEPTHTVTAGGAGLTSVAASLVRMFGTATGSEMGAPMPTVMAQGAGGKTGVVSAFISRDFGASVGHPVSAPTATATAGGGGKSRLVTPMVMRQFTGNEPTHTVTVKDRFAHIQCNAEASPFEPLHVEKARAVADMMRRFGQWDEREFVTLTIDGADYVIVDIGMRMLTPRELYRAQGFPDDYIIEQTLDGKPITKTVQISCCGNSVCPPVARALVEANCPSLKIGEFSEKAGRVKICAG